MLPTRNPAKEEVRDFVVAKALATQGMAVQDMVAQGVV